MTEIAKETRRKGLVFRAALRVAAAAFLLALVAVLTWGALLQRPQADPFQTPGFFAWLFGLEPHPAYREIPFVPTGSRLGFVPRDLCASPDHCGGLKAGPDDRGVFQDSAGSIRTIARLHWSRSSGQLFAI